MTEPTQDQLSKLVSKLVSNEVIYCVSMLISELQGKDEYTDQLLEISVQDDWEGAVQEHIYHGMGDDEIKDYLTEADIHEYNAEDAKNTLYNHLNDTDWFEEFGQELNLDPHQNEALEHWIVSDWLADKLEAQGEMILRDFMGLTIWGRTCSGQAIMMDGVIADIWKSIQ